MQPMVSDSIHCELLNGIPVIQGAGAAYYHFDHLGQRRLVLNRKQHERILIDGAAEIVVLSITGDEVQFGVLRK
jgi:hypothetical protein